MIYDSISEAQIVGLTIFGEARNQPIAGQIAVGAVIRNRLHTNSAKYKNYKGVCLEKLQFSCWNMNDPNYPSLSDLAIKLANNQQIAEPLVRQAIFVGQGIVNWLLLDNTRSSLNYLTKELFYSDKRPLWAKKIRNEQEIGDHIFFTA